MAKKAQTKTKPKYVKACPKCGSGMIATRVIGYQGGMYWVCDCGEHVKCGRGA